MIKAGSGGMFRRLEDVLSVRNGSGFAEKWTSESPCPGPPRRRPARPPPPPPPPCRRVIANEHSKRDRSMTCLQSQC